MVIHEIKERKKEKGIRSIQKFIHIKWGIR